MTGIKSESYQVAVIRKINQKVMLLAMTNKEIFFVRIFSLRYATFRICVIKTEISRPDTPVYRLNSSGFWVYY